MKARYVYIHREEGDYPIRLMCRWAKVSCSGCYAWRGRGMSGTRKRREELAILVKHFFNESRRTCGYRRVHRILERNGVETSPETVRQLMRQEGLVACHPRPKVRTAVPARDLAERPDLIRRDFTADAPARKWAGGITCIHTWEGFVHLATIMDCCSKKIVGYALAERMRTELIRNALEMAVRNCSPIKGVTIFHSDRGSQYTSADCASTMNKHGVPASAGRTGICYDNAAAESFNATCKKELVNRKIYPARRKAIKDVTSWIELCCNQTRLHSTIGCRTPNEVHQTQKQNKTAA